MAEDQPQKYGTHLQNLIVERQVRQRRQEFIDALRPDDILKLVVPYHERGSEATFFRDPVRGSYNMCYFVQMPSSDAARSPDRWVVRVPLDPYLPFGSETKLESEIATMM